jgi:hypothetical protein
MHSELSGYMVKRHHKLKHQNNSDKESVICNTMSTIGAMDDAINPDEHELKAKIKLD